MNKIYGAVTSEWFIIAAWIAVCLIGYGFVYDFDGIPLIAFILTTGAIALVLTYRAGQRSRNPTIRFWINRALVFNAEANREFYSQICGEEKTEARITRAWKDEFRPKDNEWGRL